MPAKILVVEDSPDASAILQSFLSFKFELDIAETLDQARQFLKKNRYELILLDVMLPDGLGFDFCCEIKRGSTDASQTPVIFLTAKNAVSDKVLGFSIGADDYITKPFEPAELMARIESKIIKAAKSREIAESFKAGPFRFELTNMSLFAENGSGEKKIEVTPIEFKLLLKLAQNRDRVFSRQQLIDTTWGASVHIDDRCVDKHISTIRKKIEPHQKSIKTVSGVGYEFRA